MTDLEQKRIKHSEVTQRVETLKLMLQQAEKEYIVLTNELLSETSKNGNKVKMPEPVEEEANT